VEKDKQKTEDVEKRSKQHKTNYNHQINQKKEEKET